MRDYVFLGKIKNSDDRDVFAYIDCEYTDRLQLSGACYSGFEEEFKKEFENDNFESFLSKEELKKLFENQGIKEAIEKLQSNEALEFADKIFEAEHEYMMDCENLSSEELEEIIENYYLPYRDRAIISYIWNNYEELAEEWVASCYNVDTWVAGYIDYEAMGEDLAGNEDYYVLDDGRIVQYNY